MMWRRKATQHGGHRSRPQRRHCLPGFANFRIGRHGGEFALPKRHPILRQAPQVGHIGRGAMPPASIAEPGFVPARCIPFASFGSGVVQTGFPLHAAFTLLARAP
jgi:hypothetical protein